MHSAFTLRVFWPRKRSAPQQQRWSEWWRAFTMLLYPCPISAPHQRERRPDSALDYLARYHPDIFAHF